MALMSDDDVDAAAQTLGGWQRQDGALRRSITFDSFLDGIEGVRRIAELAELADHHPDIDIRWRTVNLALSTHSEGGITDKDVELARHIDALFAR